MRIAGLDPRTLAVGGAFTAVVVGLAAQQTLGNLIAGTVLLSARPFRVGERVRFQGGPVAGEVEGVVSSLGLLYTTLAQGDDRIMVPNSVVLNLAIMPLREPDSRRPARPPAGRGWATPPTSRASSRRSSRSPPARIRTSCSEEVDGDEVVVRITATPQVSRTGPAARGRDPGRDRRRRGRRGDGNGRRLA